MNESYHHIRRLYLEKLTGTISEREDFELIELLRTDIDAQRIWESLEKERRDLNADIILERIDPERELEELNSHLFEDREPEAVPIRNDWWKWVAATVVLGIGFSYFFNDLLPWNNRSEGEVAVAHQDTAGTNEIKLMFADGNSVVFAKDGSEEYSVSGMQLESSGNQLKYTGQAHDVVTFNTLAVPATKDYSITLSDGTRVFLNSESTLRFPFYFSGETREVFIEGEAYLEVTKDAKPFIVHTPLADIKVLGTRFNVNTYHKGVVRTSLVEGKVLLQTENRKPLQLLPGQEASYSEERGFATANFDAAEVLAWREGVFYFQHQPLEELSGILSRWFGTEVVFEREKLASHKVSGMLEKGHLEEFLHDLNKTSGISYTLKGATLILK